MTKGISCSFRQSNNNNNNNYTNTAEHTKTQGPTPRHRRDSHTPAGPTGESKRGAHTSKTPHKFTKHSSRREGVNHSTISTETDDTQSSESYFKSTY